jgi:ribosomal protein L17
MWPYIMKKHVFGRKFKRDKNERKALFKNLLTELVLHEQIKTTEEKAKAIKGDFDKLVTRRNQLKQQQVLKRKHQRKRPKRQLRKRRRRKNLRRKRNDRTDKSQRHQTDVAYD